VDPSNILPFAAILIGAIVIVIVLFRLMRARHHRRDAEQGAAPLTVDEEEYLDSSHIGGPIAPRGDHRQSDAAARALRDASNKRRS